MATKKIKMNELRSIIKQIIKEEIDVNNLDNMWDNTPQGEKDQLMRDYEGNNISFNDYAILTPWVYDNKNSDIKRAIIQHDKKEEGKSNAEKNTAMDIFYKIIFSNLKTDGKRLFGLDIVGENLSKKFGVNKTDVIIELGRLIKNKLPKYEIKN